MRRLITTHRTKSVVCRIALYKLCVQRCVMPVYMAAAAVTATAAALVAASAAACS
jgi:hypothetical protein